MLEPEAITTAPSMSGPTARARRRLEIAFRARETGLLVALVVVCAGMAIAAPAFLTLDNLFAIGRNSSEIGIMALGMTLVLITAQVDLSVGAMYSAGGIMAGLTLTHTGSPILALVAALAVGLTTGCLNGVLVGPLGLNSFMVTLGTMSVVTGVLALITSGGSVSLPDSGPEAANVDTFLLLAKTLPGGINMELVFLVLLVLFLGWGLRNTTFGFRMFAVGGNPRAARIGGIRVSRVIVGAFAISGALSAFSGVLAFSFVGSMDSSSGTNLMFDVFAASVIGGSSLTGGRGSMFGTLLGALFLSTARNGFILLGFPAFAHTVAVGALIIVALGIDRWVSGKEAE